MVLWNDMQRRLHPLKNRYQLYTTLLQIMRKYMKLVLMCIRRPLYLARLTYWICART